MDLRDVCQTDVATTALDDTIREATWIMRERHVGDLVVVEESSTGDPGRHKPLGILTDRDIVIEVVAEGSKDLDSTLVGDVATEDLVCADHDASTDDALELMQRHGIRRLPLIDDQGNLFGIVTLDDMLSYITHQMAALSSVVGAEISHEIERDR